MFEFSLSSGWTAPSGEPVRDRSPALSVGPLVPRVPESAFQNSFRAAGTVFFVSMLVMATLAACLAVIVPDDPHPIYELVQGTSSYCAEPVMFHICADV
jgi:hypothetical protein